MASEHSSLPPIAAFLRDTLDAEAAETRSSSKSAKRKRKDVKGSPHHQLFPPTPLDGLVTDGMSDDNIWQQLEFRGAAIEQVLSKILVSTGAAPEADDDDEEADDEVSKKAKTDALREDEDEEMVHDLNSMSDAELRAIGIDPSMRQQLLDGIDDQGFEDGDEEEEGEDLGYPGASDYSSDEDEPAGSSKRVYYEPLRTEREQRRKKEEDERKEMERVARLTSMRRKMGIPDDDEDDEDDEGDFEDEEADLDEEDEDDEAEVEVESELESEMDEDTNPAPASKAPRSILDSLDNDAGPSTSKPGSRKGPRHPTLDDDWFSIDEFNRQTEEQERREIFKEANGGRDEDQNEEDDIDMFKAVNGAAGGEDDEEDDGDAMLDGPDPSEIRFADFFMPPAGSGGAGRGSAQRRAKGKGKGSRVGQGARLAKQQRDIEAPSDQQTIQELQQLAEDEDVEDSEEDQGEEAGQDEEDESSESEAEGPARPSAKVRFAPQVAIRNIKARHKKGEEELDGEITPELLKALSEQAGGDDEGSEEEEDSEAEEDVDDEDSEDEEEDGDKVPSEEEDEQEVESEAGGSAFDEDRDQETARRFAGDLFGDDDDDEGEEGDANGTSAHERRLSELQAEIKRLEEENVAGKNWTLAGEASSRARPKDSLLEEDLDYEQSSRPTPTITIEKTEALEELIKRRILENRFDDVVPRRVFAQPEYKAEAELSDRKSGKSLAEEYEEDFRRASGDVDPEEYKSESQRKLEADREAVSSLMDDLFDKLDALSNAHYTPRAPKAAIKTLSSSTPAIAMEASSSALPTTANLESQLAPHEIVERDDVSAVMRGDASELSPEEKQALHRRKKRMGAAQRKEESQNAQEKTMNETAGKKVGGAGAGAGTGAGSKSSDQREKDEAMKKLLGTKGVTVVGKGAPKGKGKGDRGQKAGGGDQAAKRGEGYKL